MKSEMKIIIAEKEKMEEVSITRLEELEEVKRTSGGSTTVTTAQTLEITQLKTQIESYKAASHVIEN